MPPVSVYKSMGSSIPLTCAWAVTATTEAGLDGAVEDGAQVTEYLHKQSRTCNQHDKGVVNPFTVNKVNIFGIFDV